MCEPDILITINKKPKRTTREELEKLQKNDLIDLVLKLDAHNFQLRNLLYKKLNENNKKADNDRNAQTEQKETQRSFNFTTSQKRHVLLKLLYFGWDYHGFASQEDSHNTIEHHLFDALSRTCLIETRATANYHRCGRTDKEVSAFCQVISIDLRSKLEPDKQLNPDFYAMELDYCGILNRVLPKNVQCVAWMPLQTKTFSARFDCSSRTYRYYFPRGDLNINAMRKACKILERHADFRNFCKMDVQNGVTCFKRHVEKVKVELCANQFADDDTGYSMYFLEIKANAFLFHQIRCIMTVLFLIGQGKEEVTVVDELLDVEKNPCKPQYSPASGLPLNLFKCEFVKQSKESTKIKTSNQDDISNRNEKKILKLDSTESDQIDFSWVYEESSLRKLIEDLQSQWTLSNVKTTMLRNVLDELTEILTRKFEASSIRFQVPILQDAKPPRQYQKLLNRKRCESLESRIEHFVKKQRLVIKSNLDNSK